MEYTLSDFDYKLPKKLIAQKPLKKRSESRLMVLNRKDQSINHYQFKDIIQFLNPEDLLILNNTKVFQARIWAKKKTGGQVEILFLKKVDEEIWQVMLTGAGKMRLGVEFELEDAKFKIIKTPKEGGLLIFGLSVEYSGDFFQFLEHHGVMPLPPYIDRASDRGDLENYQTVFAEKPGAAAAPTAGFHFTKELLETIHERGTAISFVTLHVGYGTFSPVKNEKLERHDMHEEEYEVGNITADKINQIRKKSGRIFACGTTTLRTLESALNEAGKIKAGRNETNLFIYPPMKVESIDALVTNFHLPKSTLLMLVSAFGGYDFIRRAYNEAIKEKYRFYSYGDAMLIL